MAAFARGIGMFGYSLVEMKTPEHLEPMKKYIYDRLADGTFKPEIAKTFSFDQTVDAYKYLESNQQVGKVVITF